jgi:tellurite methyltransferase
VPRNRIGRQPHGNRPTSSGSCLRTPAGAGGASRVADSFDTIVAIGLLLFLPEDRALALLDDSAAHVRPGGHAIVNVLIQGTTYLDMFEPGRFYLFAEHEVERHFSGWNIAESRIHRFDAPGGTIKAFATVVARTTQKKGPDGR